MVAGITGVARARRAADARSQHAGREEADRQPAVGARSAAHQGRRLQRAHRAVRGAGAIDRHSGAHQRRPRLRARRVLLPRLARGLSSTRASGRGAVAAGRSDVQSVSGRRHARAPRARRPRQAGGDPADDRQGEDVRVRSRGRAELDADPGRPAGERSAAAGDRHSAPAGRAAAGRRRAPGGGR